MKNWTRFLRSRQTRVITTEHGVGYITLPILHRWASIKIWFSVVFTRDDSYSTVPSVVWAGESKTALEFEIGPRQQKIWWHLNLQLMGLCYKEGHGLVDNVAWRWRFCRRDICDICRTTPIWRKMTSFNDVTWRLSTCCFQRRSERLGVTKRHELLGLALLLHVQSPGTYFMSSYTYRKLNNFRLTRCDTIQ